MRLHVGVNWYVSFKMLLEKTPVSNMGASRATNEVLGAYLASELLAAVCTVDNHVDDDLGQCIRVSGCGRLVSFSHPSMSLDDTL